MFLPFQDFVPFVDKCLKRLFPIQEQMVVTSDAKFTLNIDTVVEQLKDSLPLVKEASAIAAANAMPTAPAVSAEDKDQAATEYVIDRTSVIDQEIAKTLTDVAPSKPSE